VSLLTEVRRIYSREHPVFRHETTPLRAALSRPARFASEVAEAEAHAEPAASDDDGLSADVLFVVFRRARDIARDHGLAEDSSSDVAQEVLLGALLARPGLSSAELDAWVTAAATQSAKDRLRSHPHDSESYQKALSEALASMPASEVEALFRKLRGTIKEASSELLRELRARTETRRCRPPTVSARNTS
jgi:DNA-directed RNA polymerase specialized sigma24 family protein